MAGSILSPVHLALLLVVVLLLFGANRLPELGKSLGSSMRAFKDSIESGEEPPPQGPQESPTPLTQRGAGEPGGSSAG